MLNVCRCGTFEKKTNHSMEKELENAQYKHNMWKFKLETLFKTYFSFQIIEEWIESEKRTKESFHQRDEITVNKKKVE